jgi:hypothetical protein
MSTELFDHIATFIKDIGGPTAISFGLLYILQQQTSILKGIRESLDRLHDAVSGRKDSPSHDTTPPKVGSSRPVLGH